MKRYLIATGILLGASVILVMGNDYHANVVEDVSLVDQLKAEMPMPISVDYPALNDADQMNPKFTSNFNRLVEFPELGSPALCDGYTRVARGPPRSHRYL